ncbi:MAG: hypothetical protein ACYCO0_04405 [Candidatus Micrarchaeaceae archaeon]
MASVKVMHGNPERHGLSAKEREYLQQLIPLYQKKIYGLDLATLDSKRSIALIQDRDKIASLQYSLGMISEATDTRNESVRIIDLKVDALEKDMLKNADVVKQHEKTAKELYNSLSANSNRTVISAASESSWRRLEELQKTVEKEWKDIQNCCEEVITYRIVSATIMLLVGNYDGAFETAFNVITRYNTVGIFGPAEMLMIGLIANSEDIAAVLVNERKISEAIRLLEISLKSAENSASMVEKLADSIHDIINLEVELEKHVATILVSIGREREAHLYIQATADKHVKKNHSDIAISLLGFGMELDSASFEMGALPEFKSINRE